MKRDRAKLQRFLRLAAKIAGESPAVRLAFEFRHESWFSKDIYDLLRYHGAALCIADSPRYPRRDVLTTDFAYLRFHGRTELFASKYSEGELRQEARLINGYLKQGKEVFVYFNNDAQGHAVGNARTLRSLIDPAALPSLTPCPQQEQEKRRAMRAKPKPERRTGGGGWRSRRR